MSSQHLPGWFGKLASLGDFAHRRLQPDWVQACDRWLSDGLQASQQQLGERWLATYLGAPVWRFAWAPGVVDAHWWFGVLMPSCDNVGRYFPLLVAQPRTHAPADRFALDHLELWWDGLARAALHTLTEGSGVEDFERSLHQLPPWPGGGATPALQPLPATWPDASVARYGVPAGATLTGLMQALSTQALLRQCAGHSLWWPLHDNRQAGQCTLSPGLPPPAAFADLLRGQW